MAALATNLTLARLIAPSEFGLVATVQAVTLVIFVFFDFGVSTWITRVTAVGDTGRIEAGLRLNQISSLTGAAVAMMVAWFLGQGSSFGYAFILIALAFAFEKSGDAIMGIPIARGDRPRLLRAILMRRLIALAVFFGLVLAEASPIPSFSFATLLGASLSWIYVRKTSYGVIDTRSSPFALRMTLRECYPFFIANITAAVRNLDVPIISFVSGASASGMWAAAHKLTTPFMLIPGAISSAIVPYSSKASAPQVRAAGKKLIAVHLIMLLVLLVLGLFSDELVALVLGSQYAEAGPILQWTLLAFPLIALSTSLGGLLQGFGHERFVASNGALFSTALILGIVVSASLASLPAVAITVFFVYFVKVALLVMRLLSSTAQPKDGSSA